MSGLRTFPLTPISGTGQALSLSKGVSVISDRGCPTLARRHHGSEGSLGKYAMPVWER